MTKQRIKSRNNSTNGTVAVETAQGESIDHLVKRVKRELLWVLASSAAAIGLGLLAGSLIKF